MKTKLTKGLPKSFAGKGKVKGINFEQVAASPQAYIYACTHENQDPNTNPYYEVFKRKSVAVCVDFEKRIYSETEFKEVYPNAEKFGSSAWCIWNKERAFEKFKELSIVELAIAEAVFRKPTKYKATIDPKKQQS